MRKHYLGALVIVSIFIVMVGCKWIDDTHSDKGGQPKFVEYDTAPSPVGDYAALYGKLEYPEPARKAGIEGTVMVQTIISTDGRAGGSTILEGVAEGGLNEAAVTAIEGIPWNPAMRDGEPVEVWITIPVKFHLQDKDMQGTMEKKE